MSDYTPELAELAQVSEGGCNTFEVNKLTSQQRQAILAIVEMSGKLNGGDIVYGEYIVRIIKHELGRFATVISTPLETNEYYIY